MNGAIDGLQDLRAVLRVNQVLEGSKGTAEGHRRQTEDALQFRRKHQRVTIKVLMKCAHAAGFERETVPGLTLLKNLHDVLFLAVAAIEVAG